jgi:hypothetical protein
MIRFAASLAMLALLAAPASAQQSFAIGHIDREGQPTKQGPHRPPWTRTIIQAGFFGVPANKTLSGAATILPHDPALPPATLPIKKFGPQVRDECLGQMSKYRQAEFPDLPGEAYRAYVGKDTKRGASFVSPVLIVHPARPNAKTLPKQSMTQADMPKGYPLATLEAAFDLSGSGQAEVVQLEYCCRDPAFDNAQCIKAGGADGGVRCTAIFQKGKAGWRRLFMERNEDC